MDSGKKLVILSGGMDSSTVLAWVLQKVDGANVETVTFNYGSKHNAQENKAAQNIAKHYGVKNTLIKLDFMRDHFKSNLLKNGGDIPDGHYADQSMKKTVVPFRNGILMAIAAGFAESIEADEIYLGNHTGDHAIYPDCRATFTQPMEEAIYNGTYRKIKAVFPFGEMNKTDLCRIGGELHVPYHLTYSCYKGSEIHCGTCGTCTERKEAFQDANVADPTLYRDSGGIQREIVQG